MFSRLTADRFEDRQKENSIGPGSYDLPDTNDDRAPSLAVPGDRFNENGTATPGPGFYTKDGQEVAEPVLIQQLSTRSRMSTSGSKENRPPSARGKAGQCPLTREIEQLKRQLNQAERQKEQDNAKLQKSLESIQVQLRDARERAERSEACVRAKGEELRKVEAKINASEDQVRKCNDRATKQDARISELGSKAEESRKAAEHVEQVASERSDHIKGLQLEAVARSEDVTRLEATVAHLETDSRIKEVEISGVRQQLAEAVRQGEGLQLNLDDVQTQLGISKQRADDAEVLAATKAEDLARAEAAVAVLEEQTSRSLEQHQDQDRRIADLTVKAESDMHKISAAEEEVGVKDDEIAKLSAQLDDMLRQGKQTVADLEHRLHNMETQLSNAEQRADNAEADAASKAEDLVDVRTTAAALEEQVRCSHAKHEEHESSIADLTAKAESDSDKISAHEVAIARLEKDVLAKEVELAKASARLEEEVQQRNQTSADMQRAEADAATNAEILARAETAVAALEGQASRSTEKIREQELCIADLTQKVHATEGTATCLEEDLGARERELATAREELQEARQQREQTAGDLQSGLVTVQSQLRESKRQADLAQASAVLKAEELAHAETVVAALEEQARRSRERLHEQETCIADLTAKSEADSRKIRASEAAIEVGRASFDEAKRKMSEQFTELQEKLGEFQLAREKQQRHTLEKAREAREAEERMRQLDNARRRLKEREVHQAAAAVVNGVLFRVMSAETEREQEVQSHEIARLAGVGHVLSCSLDDCNIRHAASMVVNTMVIKALSTEARLELEMRCAETAKILDSLSHREEQFQCAESQIAGLSQKLTDIEARLLLETQQHELEQSQFKVDLAESRMTITQHRKAFTLCENASEEIQSLELQSFSRLVVHQALLKASHALGEQDQQEGTKVVGQLAHVSNELKTQHEAIAQHEVTHSALQSTIDKRDVQLALMQEEKQRQAVETSELHECLDHTTQTLEEKESQQVAAKVVSDMLFRTILQETRSNLEVQCAQTTAHAEAERSLLNSLNDCHICYAAAAVVNTTLINVLSAETRCEFQMQLAETERFSNLCLQYETQFQEALSQKAEVSQKLDDAETRLAMEAHQHHLEQLQFKVELAESRMSITQHSAALEVCESASEEIQSLELRSFSCLVVHQALLKASHVLGEQDQQGSTEIMGQLSQASNELKIQSEAIAQHEVTQRALQNAIEEKDVQLVQMQEEKQRHATETRELGTRLDRAEQAVEEAHHSARQCQFDAEERIRRASLESESRASELWSEIDRLRGDATRCEELEKQVSIFGRAKVAAESAARESQRNLERYQQKVEHLEAQESRKQRQSEELSGLRRENEEQQEQIRQIASSLQHFQGKNEALKRENRSLEEKVSCMEGDLERVADQHATLMGHTNQKQKIRYTLRLKEESIALRQELHKAQQRAAQVEESASRSGASTLFDVFLSHAGAQSSKRMEPQLVRTPGRQQPTTTPVTPGQTTPSSRTPRGAGSSMRLSRASIGKEQDVEEMRQRCKFQERALERIRADFQHVLTLVERAADVEDGSFGDVALAGLLEQLRNHPGVSAQLVSSEPPRTPLGNRSLEGRVSPFGGSAADDFVDGQSLAGEEGEEGKQN